MINELTLLAHWSVRQKLNHVSSVQFSNVDLYSPLEKHRHQRTDVIAPEVAEWHISVLASEHVDTTSA